MLLEQYTILLFEELSGGNSSSMTMIETTFWIELVVLLPIQKQACSAWALIPNHFHLLLRTGQAPIATVMRRLLTGHTDYFNKRHRRTGHLFQNRYQSMRKAKIFKKSDERILGDGDFVDQVLSVAQEQMKQRNLLISKGYTLNVIAERVSEEMDIDSTEIWKSGKSRNRVAAWSLLCF